MEVGVIAYQDLQAQRTRLESENLRLQLEIRDLRLELQEIKVSLGSAPELAKILAKSLGEVGAKFTAKTKGKYLLKV